MKVDLYRVCHRFRLIVARWLFSSHFWGSWGNNQNCLEPKTEPTSTSLTKLSSSKSMTHSLRRVYTSRFRMRVRHCVAFSKNLRWFVDVYGKKFLLRKRNAENACGNRMWQLSFRRVFPFYFTFRSMFFLRSRWFPIRLCSVKNETKDDEHHPEEEEIVSQHFSQKICRKVLRIRFTFSDGSKQRNWKLSEQESIL